MRTIATLTMAGILSGMLALILMFIIVATNGETIENASWIIELTMILSMIPMIFVARSILKELATI